MELKMIPLNKISPSPFQPREGFDKESIRELAESIKEFSLLHPILVRPLGNGNYQIIAGERRWRASQFAGLKEIPVIVKDVDERRQMAESIIENVQREDLHGVEKGRGVHELFILYGIDMEPKELANKIHMIDDKLKRPERYSAGFEPGEKKIKKVCDLIGKSLDTIRHWLEEVSAEPQIVKVELSKPKEKRVPEQILGRLSTIEDTDLQKKVYQKITEQEMGYGEASRLITKVKRMDEETREEVLKPGIKILDVDFVEPEFKLDMSEEELAELRARYEDVQERTKEILAKPDVQERGKLRRNWQAHTAILDYLGVVTCPICGAGPENLKWTCHNLSIKEAQALSAMNYQKAIKGGDKEDNETH